MFSRYVAYHYFSRNRSVRASKIALFGEEQARAIDPFGASLVKVAQAMPIEHFPINHLLEKSTFFGFYSAALPPERRDAWRKNQMAARARLINKFITGQAGFFLTKQHLHFCPLCVEEDEKAYGLGYWRLIHQVPGIAHCHIHNVALSGVCVRCQVPIASEENWNPPSRHCPYCSGHVFCTTKIPRSAAYQKFTKLCEAVLDGTPTSLIHENRAKFYSCFYDSSHSHLIQDRELNRLIELVLTQWEVPNLDLLGHTISSQMNERFVRQAIIGQDHVVNPVGHLSLISALELAEPFNAAGHKTSSSTTRALPLDSRCTEILTANNINPERLASALKRLALQHGLPEKTGLMLIEGKTHKTTFRDLGVCGARVGEFAKVLNELEMGDFLKDQKMLTQQETKNLRFEDIIKLIRKEELREKNRNVIRGILEFQKVTRSRLSELAPRSFLWCRINDKQWLAQSCPPETTEEKRTRHRNRILNLVKTGCRTQRSVRKKDFKAYHWCWKYDRVWLDTTIPVYSYKHLSVEEMRTLCRSVITNALSVGISDRRHLPFRAITWCRQNDAVWLDSAVPRRDFRPSAA
jgi:DNA-directed RNA polymerase subunit RPC12/RpoP